MSGEKRKTGFYKTANRRLMNSLPSSPRQKTVFNTMKSRQMEAQSWLSATVLTVTNHGNGHLYHRQQAFLPKTIGQGNAHFDASADMSLYVN